MKARAKININHVEYEFEIEGKDEMDTLHRIIVLTNPRRYCHECQEIGNIRLDSNKDKEGNTYVNVVCKCGAKSKLGQYKTGGYFWRDFEKYDKANASNESREGAGFKG